MGARFLRTINSDDELVMGILISFSFPLPPPHLESEMVLYVNCTEILPATTFNLNHDISDSSDNSDNRDACPTTSFIVIVLSVSLIALFYNGNSLCSNLQRELSAPLEFGDQG